MSSNNLLQHHAGGNESEDNSIVGRELEAHPNGTSRKSSHATPESRLLALGSNTFVYTFPKPDIGLHVPRIQEDFEVGSKFDHEDIDIRRPLPK